MLLTQGPHFENHWNRGCDLWHMRRMRCVLEVRQKKGQRSQEARHYFPCLMARMFGTATHIRLAVGRQDRENELRERASTQVTPENSCGIQRRSVCEVCRVICVLL